MSEPAVFLANSTARSGLGAELQQAVLDELLKRDIKLTILRTHNAMDGDGSVHHAVSGVVNAKGSAVGSVNQNGNTGVQSG